MALRDRIRRRRGPDRDLIETVLAQDGRIRLLDRHLLRLRAAGASTRQVTTVRTLAATWVRTARHRPTVVRFDVGVDGTVASTARRPPGPGPVALWTVPGHAPDRVEREVKAADRGWTEGPEAAARAAGADEPVLVGDGPDPEVGETTRASVLVLGPDGVLRAPPVAGLLPGVTRGWVLEAAAARGVVVREAPVPLSTLRAARAVLVPNAARGLAVAGSLDGAPLPVDDPLVAELRRGWLALR